MDCAIMKIIFYQSSKPIYNLRNTFPEVIGIFLGIFLFANMINRPLY